MTQFTDDLVLYLERLGARILPAKTRPPLSDRKDGSYLQWRQNHLTSRRTEALDVAIGLADHDVSAAAMLMAAIATAVDQPDAAQLPHVRLWLFRAARAWRRALAHDLNLVTLEMATEAVRFTARPKGLFGRTGPSQALPLEKKQEIMPGHLIAGPPVLAHPVRSREEESFEEYNILAQPIPRVRLREVDDLAQSLADEFPWLADMIEDLLRPARLEALNPSAFFKLPPTVVFGAPGVGKTALISSLASAAQLPLACFQAGGTFESWSVSGIAKGWRTATPSLAVRAMASAKLANPIVLIDELDKAAAENHAYGRMTDALLAMLEPSTARHWTDPCLQVAVDLSAISWIMLVNDAAAITGPLRSRVRLLQARGPRAEHADVLIARARAALAAKAGRPLELTPDLEPSARARITRDLDERHDIRRVLRAVHAALSAAPWPKKH